MTATEPPEPTGKFHDAWVKIGEAIHARVAPRAAQVRTDATTDLLEKFEDAIAPIVKPFIAQLVEHPDTPPEVKALLEPLARPEHFTDSVFLGFGLGAILSPVLGNAIAPVVQAISNSSWSLATLLPGTNATVPPSPVELAMGNLKGVDAPGGNAVRAAESGTKPEDLDFLTKIAGNAIGIEQALLLYRRKQIPLDSTDPNAPGLKQVLQYSNVNPLFYNLPELLQYVPISAGEVVTANLKGHLDDATAVTLLQEAGLDGSKEIANGVNLQQLLRASAGRPPGIQQMLQLRNRSAAGFTDTPVGDTELAAAVRQSDINDDYLPEILELGKYIPPPRSVVPMLRSGAIKEDRARALLRAHGVQGDDIDAFILEATVNHTGVVKEATAAQVTRAYEEALIQRPEAVTQLTALKYTADAIDQMLTLADNSRTNALRNSGVARVRTQYLGHKLNDAQAQAELTQLGLPAAAVTEAMKFFTIEKGAITHVPSIANVLHAFASEVISASDAHARLLAAGIDQKDMAIVGSMAWAVGKVQYSQLRALIAGSGGVPLAI